MDQIKQLYTMRQFTQQLLRYLSGISVINRFFLNSLKYYYLSYKEMQEIPLKLTF